MNKVELIRLFPTLIYDVECSELIDDVLFEFNNVNWDHPNAVVNDTHFTLKKNKKLTKKFNDVVNNALSEHQYQVPLKMSTSWFTRVKPNSDGRNHYHVNSFYSGVFYFQDNCSKLVVEKELPQIHVPWNTKDFSLIPSGNVGLLPQKGHMLLIPGNIRHYIKENMTNNDRHSLAMNFMPSGFCDFDDSSYNYR